MQILNSAIQNVMKFLLNVKNLKQHESKKLKLVAPTMKECVFTYQRNTKKKKLGTYYYIISSANIVNPLTPNDPYRGRTAPLTSKRCILYI